MAKFNSLLAFMWALCCLVNVQGGPTRMKRKANFLDNLLAGSRLTLETFEGALETLAQERENLTKVEEPNPGANKDVFGDENVELDAIRLTLEAYKGALETLEQERENITEIEELNPGVEIEDGDELLPPEEDEEIFGPDEKKEKSMEGDKMIEGVEQESMIEGDKMIEGVEQESMIEGDKMIEGDMLVTREQLELGFGQEKSNNLLTKRDGVRNPRELWPGAIVPYKIDDGIQLKVMRYKINEAIVSYETKTCMRFDPWKRGRGIHIQSGCGGCYSYVGYQGPGLQTVCLNNVLCWSTVRHELGHAIGLIHEQSRSDRDKYVTIEKNHISGGKSSNFRKESPNYVNDRGLPYDFYSMMHYPSKAFAKWPWQNTIVTKDPDFQSVIGSVIGRDRMSDLDAKLVNLMYCGESKECSRMANQQDYRGTKAVSKSGKRCRRWDSGASAYNNPSKKPLAGLESNYCRNPDKEPRVWCYVEGRVDGKTPWEFCDVPQCENQPGRLLAFKCTTKRSQTLSLSCESGRIKIARAIYGYWSSSEDQCHYIDGDCIHSSSDADHCNGRSRCNVLVKSAEFMLSCGGWHDYLQVHYDCV